MFHNHQLHSFVALVSMPCCFCLCMVSLLMPWWKDGDDNASLWRYRAEVLGIAKEFGWGEVCNNFSLVGDVRTGCMALQYVRVFTLVSAALALLSAATNLYKHRSGD